MGCKAKKKYLDRSEPLDIRIRDLLDRMTIREKIREMGMYDASRLLEGKEFSRELAHEFFDGIGIGVLQDVRLDPYSNACAVNEIQRFLKEETRLGIPALIVAETLHGHLSGKSTVFPQSIGLACTWNPELVRLMAGMIAEEARAVGVSQGLAPVLDLARDPRWGRVEETYGEDPYLITRFGVEYIRGLQGEQRPLGEKHIVATPKHFAAHGSPEGGLNLSPVSVGPRQLRELYLPPFEAAIVEARALSIMPAYSEYDGIPCSSSKQLLTDLLKNEWGFAGYVFSDYGAIDMLVSMHRTAESVDAAGKQALEAGMDLEAPHIHAFGDRLLRLVQSGEVSEELINVAVSRILKVKFLARLFDNPYVDVDQAATIVNCDRHRQLALELARESVVLLKNEGNLLPLNPDIKSIAVIGPNAAQAQLGDYVQWKRSAVTPLRGIQNSVSPHTEVRYAKGCEITRLSTEGIAEAVAIARDSEVAIVVVGGGSTGLGGVGWGDPDTHVVTTCGEGFDRAELDLPGVQQQLVEAVVATGTPTVVVLVHGRPYSISWITEHVQAVLEAWYPGEEGGNALGDIIFGKCNPSGKLAISIPRTVGQVPVFYNHKPSARGYYKEPGFPAQPGRDYVFTDPAPLYEFGYGLSYTEFEYSDLRIIPKNVDIGENVRICVTVKNVGQREGKETVQLYVNDEVSSVTTPVKVLKGFRKINLKPGEKQEVSFVLSADDLWLINADMQKVVEPGFFEITIGSLKGRFEVQV